MWDVNQDTETLIDEFMTAYYKDAAPYIKECFNAYRQRYQTLEDEAEAKGETIHFASYISSQPLYKSTEWWPKAWLETTLDTFDKALAAVENSDLDADTKEKVCYRVRAERLSAGYLLMELYHDELTNAEKQAWIDELTDVSDRLGITGYREHSGEMETKINSWRTWITTED